MPHLLEKVQEVGWWKGMVQDCVRWCDNCVTCKATKGHTHASSSWRSERYTSPFRVLQIDLCGSWEPRSQGCNFVLTAIDMFSQWLWLVPIVDNKAPTVALALF